jgi:hypothetical protein
VTAFDLLEVGQQLDAEVGRENDGHHPRCDERNADDPEHVAGVFAGGGSGKAIGHEADSGDQRSRQHGRRRMAPGIGGGSDAAEALFHLHHHHFDGDDGVVHEQAQREDQGTQRDAIEVLARRPSP